MNLGKSEEAKEACGASALLLLALLLHNRGLLRELRYDLCALKGNEMQEFSVNYKNPWIPGPHFLANGVATFITGNGIRPRP